MSQLLKDRVAVVTGASRGIGFALAKRLAAEGAHIVAIARTQGGLEELDDTIRECGGSTTLVPLDLKDFDAIDRLGAAIHERWGRLDVLVANAGILGKLTPIGHLDPKVWDDLLAVNLTANWRLIRSLDPLLRASDAGRAVFVSSGAARIFKAYWGGYAVSKAGLEALAHSYAAEVQSSSVRVNLFNPGPVATRMRAQAMPGEDPSSLPHPDAVADAVVPLCLPGFTGNGTLVSFAA